MGEQFKTTLDYFESIMHTLDDSKRPHHDTLIDPPDPDGVPYNGWSTERLRWMVYLRNRSQEVLGANAKNLSPEELKRYIEQFKQEFLTERKAAVSKRASDEQSNDSSL